MSSPKRYDLFVQTGVELEDAFLSDCENGDWVKFADYERLREALEKYGEHVGWCTSRWSSEAAPKQCNCGLDDAISGLTPAAGSIGENDAIVAARKKEETCWD